MKLTERKFELFKKVHGEESVYRIEYAEYFMGIRVYHRVAISEERLHAEIDSCLSRYVDATDPRYKGIAVPENVDPAKIRYFSFTSYYPAVQTESLTGAESEKDFETILPKVIHSMNDYINAKFTKVKL